MSKTPNPDAQFLHAQSSMHVDRVKMGHRLSPLVSTSLRCIFKIKYFVITKKSAGPRNDISSPEACYQERQVCAGF